MNHDTALILLAVNGICTPLNAAFAIWHSRNGNRAVACVGASCTAVGLATIISLISMLSKGTP